ncbi:hypothetical protein CAP47_08710 [Psychroflexus sp. S27]|nr:hypothetical protein CAP47_08710 [Psychroflexus sp. S27]
MKQKKKQKTTRMNRIFRNTLGLVGLIAAFTACQENSFENGSDFIGSIDMQPAYEIDEITSYSEKIKSVQTNGLSNYLLGTYDDPVYGKSSTSLLTQLRLDQTSPDFGTNPEVDSVVLSFPFYGRETGENEYELDSIYGTGDFKLKIYESNYFLRTIDPGSDGDFDEDQAYYSDQIGDFENFFDPTPVFESDVITYSDVTSPITLIDSSDPEENDTINLSPRIRIKLPVSYFKSKIIDKEGSDDLVNNNKFVNYLRGLYIKMEQVGPEPIMYYLNFNNDVSEIKIHYTTERESLNVEDSIIQKNETFKMNFKGIKVNLYDNNFDVDLTSQDKINGEENIYLKGGEGSAGIINLFDGADTDGNGVSDLLEEIREKNWIINEANLMVYVNEDISPIDSDKARRLFVYNADKNRILTDYQNDPTVNNDNPSTSASIHLPPLDEDENGNKFYRLRITDHINNVINNDSTNVKLGLLLSENVNLTRVKKVQNGPNSEIDKIIESSVISPRGMVLHGSNSPDVEKRLKLRIIYTETEN